MVQDIPLELEGQLDPSKSWDVKLIFNGAEKVISIKEDCSILEAGEKVFEGVTSSCRNGVCTTCAGQVSMLKFFRLLIPKVIDLPKRLLKDVKILYWQFMAWAMIA